MAVEVLLQPRALPVARHDQRLASSSSIGGAQARTLCLQQNRLLRRATRSSVRCWATIPVPDSSPLVSDLGWPVDFAQHYVKGKLVGQGSFGSVYLGIDLHTGKEVAVKVMPKQRGKLTKDRTLQKLAKEVGILQKMQPCRNAVRLRGCFESNEEVMVVTDMCKGGDLQKLSDDHGALPERAVALIAYEVLQVVEKCHELGILHGDLKPANFVLADRTQNPLFSNDINLLFGKPWLLAIDFGCSQYLTHVRFSKRTGTPVYMAPEIFDRDYHWEADMWSLGIMLYQLYARRFPFWRTYEECRHAKLDEVAALVADSPMPFDYGPWCSMSMEGLDFMRRCLVRDYTQRMTVPQALNHPWLMQWLPECDSDSESDSFRLMSLDSMGTSDDEDALLLPPKHHKAVKGSSSGSGASPALQQQQHFEQQQAHEQQVRQQWQQHKVLVPPGQQQHLQRQPQVVLTPQQQQQLKQQQSKQQQQQQQHVHAAGACSYDPNQFAAGGPGAYSSDSSTVSTSGAQQGQQVHQQLAPSVQLQQHHQQQQQLAQERAPQQQQQHPAAGAAGGTGVTNNIVPGGSNALQPQQQQQQQQHSSSAQPAEVNAAAAGGRRPGAGQQ